MEVNLRFDTEKEPLDNLKKLVDALHQLINHRDGTSSSPAQVSTHVSSSIQQQQQQKPAPDRTPGGGRVIPYEDMSGKMSQIFSGRRSF